MTNQNNNQGDQKSKCCNAPKHTHYMASLDIEGDLCSQCGKKFIPASDQVTGLGKLIEEARNEKRPTAKPVERFNDTGIPTSLEYL